MQSSKVCLQNILLKVAYFINYHIGIFVFPESYNFPQPICIWRWVTYLCDVYLLHGSLNGYLHYLAGLVTEFTHRICRYIHVHLPLYISWTPYCTSKQIQIDTSTTMYTPFLNRIKLTTWTICTFRVLNLSQTCCIKKLKFYNQKVPKQAEAKWDGVINPQNYNFNKVNLFLKSRL